MRVVGVAPLIWEPTVVGDDYVPLLARFSEPKAGRVHQLHGVDGSLLVELVLDEVLVPIRISVVNEPEISGVAFVPVNDPVEGLPQFDLPEAAGGTTERTMAWTVRTADRTRLEFSKSPPDLWIAAGAVSFGIADGQLVAIEFPTHDAM